MVPLTSRQKAAYDAITASLRTRGIAPTYSELGAELGIGLPTVWKHVHNLAAKGYIRHRFGHARAIEVLVSTDVCPTCGQSIPQPVHVL